MTTIYGALGLNDGDRVALATLGQQVVYDAVNQVYAQFSDEVNAAAGVFVEEVTSDYARNYKLAGGGRMQRKGSQSQAGAVKATGEWPVQLPLEEFGDAVAADRVAYAYMTTQDLNRHVVTVQTRYLNTRRFEILRALFNNTARPFYDELRGDLTVQPLANGDGVLYPPVLGSEDEATDNHYIESGYLASDISDSNDPYLTIRDELEEHFGAPTGGSEIVAFIHPNQGTKTRAMNDFVEMTDRYVREGADMATVVGWATNLPGRIAGRMKSGVWVVEWRSIPEKYILGVHMDAPRPLLQREDPAETGLGGGLQLVAESELYPFTQSHYSARFGMGVGNRLNGVVIELATGGSYTTPTIFQ